MSLCSHKLFAVSRTRVRQLNTLLPFLYQTATIQQWKPTTRPIAHRNISSRFTPTEEIPFEDADGNLPPAIDDAPARKTTITYTERAAFEKLYKTFNTQGQGRPKDKIREHEELDQIADEYYEDDEDSSGNVLDKVFDAVLQGSPPSQQQRRDANRNSSRTKQSSGDPLTGSKRSLTPEPDTSQNKTQLAIKADREKVKKLRLAERERVDKLLKTTQTDQQLWQVLEREVFDQLRKLDLDGADVPWMLRSKAATPKEKTQVSTNKTEAKQDKKKETQTTTVDKRILFPNYPHHLFTALKTLRTNFPSSPLPLTILSTIKSLGRSSYALGATTLLYRHLLRTAWLQQSSYTLIDTLLTDMETNVVEFDFGILGVLDAIIREYEMAKSGRLGREMQMVYGMEMWAEGAKKIKIWRGVVADRLGVKDEIVGRGVQWMERKQRDGRERVPFANKRVGGDDISMSLVEGRNGPTGPRARDPTTKTTSDAIPFVNDEEVKTEGDRKGDAAAEHIVEAQSDYRPNEEIESPTKVLL